MLSIGVEKDEKYIFLSFSNEIGWWFLFLHQKSIKAAFKTGFQYQIIICICVGKYRILNVFCLVEKDLLDVCFIWNVFIESVNEHATQI